MDIEELRLHADVISVDGHKLGTLNRFVFREDGYKLTHIVVDTGILRSGESIWQGGWGLSHDRIVPIEVLQAATSDEIRIAMTAEEFRDLSVDFTEEYFKEIPDLHEGELDSSDLVRIATSIPGEPGPHMMQEKTVMRPGEAQIANDSPVWRLNPHQKLGEVERAIFDEDSGKIEALVIRRGFLLTKDLVLPMSFVVEVVAGIVRVQIDDDALKQLREFHPAD
jgi:sporulation protein YlmC with PRC-barrel domain